jgi:hypothetical protein
MFLAGAAGEYSIFILLVSRGLQGFGIAAVPIWMDIINTDLPKEKCQLLISLLMSTFPVGLAAGLVGGTAFMIKFKIYDVFFVIGTPYCVVAILLIFLIGDPPKQSSTEDSDLPKQSSPEDSDIPKQSSTEDSDIQKQSSTKDSDLPKQSSTEDSDPPKRSSTEDSDPPKRSSTEDSDPPKNRKCEWRNPKPFDYPGMILLAVGTFCFLIALSFVRLFVLRIPKCMVLTSVKKKGKRIVWMEK